MEQIKCPHCGEYFTIDESGYAAIVSQIKDKEFDKAVNKSKKELENNQKSLIDNAVLKANVESNKKISELESRIKELESEHKLAINQKDTEIDTLRSEKDRAIQDAVRDEQNKIKEIESQHNLEITRKDNEINNLKTEKDRAVQDAVRIEQEKIKELESEHKLAISQKNTEIQTLKTEKERAVQDAIKEEQDKIKELENNIEKKKLEYNLELNKKEELHKEEIKHKDEEIERIKEFKQKQSTKMIGESLERFCETEFNKLRATGFQSAYFEKDNDVRSGSKGDYIFRDYSDDVEYISIMFEMKNEADETKTKHKNEDFFKELDKDRKEKGCEYAVLVSMLESDNEYYNTGIVDVSYKYPKMYVIRPQFFIPVITFLRNAAFNTLSVKKELVEMQNRNIDVSTFEASLLDFKEKFGRNYELANTRFNKAIEEIDKTISHLQKVKDELLASDNQLRLANNKLDDLSIKKLTKNNPTMQQMFEDAGVDIKSKRIRKVKDNE